MERSDTQYDLGELVVTDIHFPNIKALETGNTACVIFVEMKSDVQKSYGIARKSDIKASYLQFLTFMRRFLGDAWHPKVLQCDNEKVYLYGAFKEILDSDGTFQRTSV